MSFFIFQSEEIVKFVMYMLNEVGVKTPPFTKLKDMHFGECRWDDLLQKVNLIYALFLSVIFFHTNHIELLDIIQMCISIWVVHL